MSRSRAGGLGLALAWLVFPLAPALLGRTYHGMLTGFNWNGWGDPRRWEWTSWLILTGPLLGYGFLAGATLGLTDDPERRGVRSWLARRAVWVSVGPWSGFLVLASLFYLNEKGMELRDRFWPAGWSWEWGSPLPTHWQESWWGRSVSWMIGVGLTGMLAYGWLVVAVVALRRARRTGRLRQSLERGVLGAVAFVGSLFGSFWAITAYWRSYFFDPRMVPLLVAALGLAASGGCATPMTYGDVRRGELYKALLLAWLVGLALAWRWWSRPRER